MAQTKDLMMLDEPLPFSTLEIWERHLATLREFPPSPMQKAVVASAEWQIEALKKMAAEHPRASRLR